MSYILSGDKASAEGFCFFLAKKCVSFKISKTYYVLYSPHNMKHKQPPYSTTHTAALVAIRLTYTAVFLLNVSCALGFCLFPDRFSNAYELSGVAGDAAVRGLGIAFLMWNTTYPPVIANPKKFSYVAAIVLVQQVIGLVGELLIYFALPAGHDILASAIFRFVGFDAVGLVIMTATYAFFIHTSTEKNINIQVSE